MGVEMDGDRDSCAGVGGPTLWYTECSRNNPKPNPFKKSTKDLIGFSVEILPRDFKGFDFHMLYIKKKIPTHT